jgi:hypothetical protein
LKLDGRSEELSQVDFGCVLALFVLPVDRCRPSSTSTASGVVVHLSYFRCVIRSPSPYLIKNNDEGKRLCFVRPRASESWDRIVIVYLSKEIVEGWETTGKTWFATVYRPPGCMKKQAKKKK